MDDRRFDNLTRTLARGASRRQLLKGLAGAVLGGGALLSETRGGAAFICRQPGVLCAKDAQCCSQVCDPAAHRCVCADGGALCGRQCCTADQVCQDRQCVTPCTPTTCAAQGIACGSPPDGCGGTLACGDCASAACSTGSCDQGQCTLTPIAGCCTSDDQCDDGDACTQDSCDTSTNTCTHTPLACDPQDVCHTASCEPTQGCVQTQVTDGTDCGSGQTCQQGTCACPSGTIDCGGSCQECCSPDDCPGTTCSPATCERGTCGRAPIAGCCTADTDCGDSDACTTDTCVTHTCQHTPISCQPSNACHTASCEPSQGCVQTQVTDGSSCGPNQVCCQGSCCAAGQTCGANGCSSPCTPNCAGKTCGDDGCGGSCGSCSSGQTCQNGACATACTPKTCAADYSGQCGTFDDGCNGNLTCQCGECQQCSGGTCNTGSDGASCSDGTCQSGECIRACTSFNDCIPNSPCLGGNCVDNGSGPKCEYEPFNDGQSCGPDLKICQSGRCCIPDGQPVVGPVSNCCGNATANPNGVVVCGTLSTCVAIGQSCVPGTYCCIGGLCGEPGTHAAGLCCIPDGQPATALPCCSDSIYNPGSGSVCGPPPCIPNCTGKTCGSDGCGGSCGTCPVGSNCQSGTCCKPKTCFDLKGQCGTALDDGCGGTIECTCPFGQICSEGQCHGCSSDADCPAPDACTQGTCVLNPRNFHGTCRFTNSCTATNLCDTASCTTGTCVHSPVSCPSGQICNLNNGNCVYPPCPPCQIRDATSHQCVADTSLNHQTFPCEQTNRGECYNGQCVTCLANGSDCLDDGECCTNLCHSNAIGGLTCQCSPTADTCLSNANCCNNCCASGGFCADFAVDLNNCGACGIQVPAGGICDNGNPTCTIGFHNDNGRCCPGEQVSCGSYCADLSTDPLNCGACGVHIPSGAVCNNGFPDCPFNEKSCGSYCADTSIDPLNCGNCGFHCDIGHPLCTGGRCCTIIGTDCY